MFFDKDNEYFPTKEEAELRNLIPLYCKYLFLGYVQESDIYDGDKLDEYECLEFIREKVRTLLPKTVDGRVFLDIENFYINMSNHSKIKSIEIFPDYEILEDKTELN